MKNHFFLLLLILFIACNSADQSTSKQADNKVLPNIILVMTDDTGYGDFSCNGNPILKTPHIDAMSKESARFTNFHVGTTCSPTRAGLMTGQHCNRTGTWHTILGRSLLSNRYKTIANHLKQAGYSSGIFGKWHLGDNYPFRPVDRGFDEVLIHGGGGVGQTPDYWNNDYFDDTYFHNGVAKKYEGYCTDIWFDEAIKYMESKKDDPFFCYIALNAAHGPHHAPQASIDLYKDNEAVPNAGFYGQVANIDDNVGKLRKWLEETGQAENTILIFTADNGTAGGARFDKEGQVTLGYNAGMRAQKGSMYEGGHRVPLFIQFPEKMNIPKQSYDELTTYTDMVPTLLDFVSVNPIGNPKFDGESIKPLLTKGSQLSLNDRIVVVDTQRDEDLVKWKKSSVMQEQWRLVNQEELYDLSNDANQSNNIITKHPEKVAELKAAYEKWWADHQEDAAKINYIVIGNEADNPSLITCHDWHGENGVPWHQTHIRQGKDQNGYWWINVEKAGNYRIRLHRWPGYLAKAIHEEVAEGEQVAGGKPYVKGVALNLAKAKIKIQDQEMSSDELKEEKYYEFTLPLEKGNCQMQTWMMERNEETRGAYFIEVELL